MYNPQQNMMFGQQQYGSTSLPVQNVGRPRFNTYNAGAGVQPPAPVQFQNNQMFSDFSQLQVSQPTKFRSHAVSVSSVNGSDDITAPFFFQNSVVPETSVANSNNFDPLD